MFLPRLKELREEMGLTIKETADKIGVCSKTLNKWENKNCNPIITYIIKIAEVFNVRVDYILELSNEKEKRNK